MTRIPKEGSEETRKRLPALLERAHRGKPTLITKRGEPYAAIVPISALNQPKAGIGIRDLRGTGKGFWSNNVPVWIKRIRDERE